MFGRNDGFAFTTVPVGFTTYPIGTVVNFTDTATKPTSGTTYTTTFPGLDAGVWLFSGWVSIIINGGWAYTPTSYLRLSWGANSGCTAYPPNAPTSNSVSTIQLPYTSTSLYVTLPFPLSTIVVTATGRTSVIKPQVTIEMSVGTTTRQCNFCATKIA